MWQEVGRQSKNGKANRKPNMLLEVIVVHEKNLFNILADMEPAKPSDTGGKYVDPSEKMMEHPMIIDEQPKPAVINP